MQLPYKATDVGDDVIGLWIVGEGYDAGNRSH